MLREQREKYQCEKKYWEKKSDNWKVELSKNLVAEIPFPAQKMPGQHRLIKYLHVSDWSS